MNRPDPSAALQALSQYHEALNVTREFLLRPMTSVTPSTGTDDEWVDARQFALWTVERLLDAYPDHIQQRRDEWMADYVARSQPRRVSTH